jgi:hypothetical protein
MSDAGMDDLDALGPCVSRTTDDTRLTWNVFGVTSIPAVGSGQWFASVSNHQLVYSRRATDRAPPAAVKMVEYVGDDEEVVELPASDALVPLPPDASAMTVVMDSAMKTRRLLVRRRRQTPSEPAPAEPAKRPDFRRALLAVSVIAVLGLFLIAKYI